MARAETAHKRILAPPLSAKLNNVAAEKAFTGTWSSLASTVSSKRKYLGSQSRNCML